MSSKVAAGAIEFARQQKAERIFCGHTHEAIHVEQEGVDYYNAGGWVDSRMTYLTVDEQEVRIHEYRPEVAEQDASRELEGADSSAEFADELELHEIAEYEGVGS
jgi:hypothetical protein